jgi:hypothetical protein
MIMNQLKIRQDATIHQLNIESEKLEAVQKVMNSNVTERVKKQIIKDITGYPGCCICGKVPTLEARYPVPEGGATKIERYCQSCITKLYEREQVL